MHHQDHLAFARALLLEAEAVPFDPEAKIVAQHMRELLAGAEPDLVVERMRVLLSDYALAILDENQAERRRLTQEIRLLIGSGLAIVSDVRQ